MQLSIWTCDLRIGGGVVGLRQLEVMKPYWQNREAANLGVVSSVGRSRRFNSRSSKFVFVHPRIYLKIVPSQFPLWFITWMNKLIYDTP